MNDNIGGEVHMVLYIILAIIVIILIAVGIMFYLRSNKRQLIEKAEERKVEIETLPFDQNIKNYQA